MWRICSRVVFIIILFIIYFLLKTQIYAEEINSFDVQAFIQSDGSVKISESIIYDFGVEQRHGIIRTIPYLKTNSDGKKFVLNCDSFSVTNEKGILYKYSVSNENNTDIIKIGDADQTVTGVNIYNISYRTSGAITYFSDHDELYWNVTGNDWQIPIKNASITVSLPQKIQPDQINLSCFTGVSGSSEKECSISNIENYSVKSLRSLGSGEGLTIVIGFPKNIVAMIEPKEYIGFFDTAFGKIVLFIISVILILIVTLWYIVAPGFIIVNWWYHGRDPKPPAGQAHVWFDIPKTKSLRPLTPGETGTLIDEQADMRDITATIVDLARRGFFKIVEKKKNDFYFVKNSHVPQDKLEPHEDTLLNNFFNKSDEIRVSDGDFISAIALAKNQLYEEVTKELLFEKNPQKVRVIYIIIGVFALITFNIPLTLVAFIFGYNMPKKTLFGAQAGAISAGLKNFLVSQEKQLAFQAKNQMFFEKMLPYAVAFGVEKIWAARFAGIAMTKPDWYDGYNTNTFNSIVIANAISTSMNHVVSVATPTRSSSGFSSGFSGGFSGGGGGGGGGGSW
jgi:hypothetical protein